MLSFFDYLIKLMKFPSNTNVLGQMLLPAKVTGKVKIGDHAIIKLDNYSFNEFGSVDGKVRSISLITNQTTAVEQVIETYLVHHVILPQDLLTNYGKTLKFQYELNSSGDIVVNERRLLSVYLIT